MEDDRKNDGAHRLSRRGLLLGAAAGTIGAAVPGSAAHAAQMAAKAEADTEDIVDLSGEYPFYGDAEQAGIRTPPQRYTFYMTFDLTSPLRTDLQVLLARWSAAISQLMKGKPVGQIEPARPDAIGLDTGEALNLSPACLTVTVGLGPNVFSDAYGLAGHRPPLLRELTPGHTVACHFPEHDAKTASAKESEPVAG